MEAWWHGHIVDRPCVQVRAPKSEAPPIPQKEHGTFRERWLDVEYVVERAAAQIAGTYWGGEILPTYVPDLGPELLAAAYGAELEFGEDTSWSVPVLRDWSTLSSLRFDAESTYVKKILDMTKLGLQVGHGKFIVGITDLHPGADLAASLRDPQQLCVDLLEAPDKVKALMSQIRPAFYEMFTLQERMFLEAGQHVYTTWHPLFASKRFYIPTADFSCMISEAMFREFFLQELLEEIDWLDYSIYHLDGPGALHHLDTILEIPKLGAVEFVYGAGNGPASRWMHVYRRVLEAGKNIHITVDPWDMGPFFESFPPERVMLCTRAESEEQARAIVKRVASWVRAGT